jgi:5-methylcytosine-specific restriction endonuclease McrA
MSRVLLLNASYEPLNVVSLQKAVNLLLRGCVEPVADADVAGLVRSPSTTLTVPAVLRLRRYVNVPQRGATWSRQGVLMRDRFTCVYCGTRAGDAKHDTRHGGLLLRAKTTRDDFTVDHLIPRSRGGNNSWGNTACACRWCNHRKGDRKPEEAGLKLLWEPKTPRVDYLVLAGEVPESWKMYLRVG